MQAVFFIMLFKNTNSFITPAQLSFNANFPTYEINIYFYCFRTMTKRYKMFEIVTHFVPLKVQHVSSRNCSI